MATLPFDAVADGSVTVVLPNPNVAGWIRIFHADGSIGPITRITAVHTTIPVIAGDRVVQRLEGDGWRDVRMVITATSP
jgi:hypothetical protein